MTSKRKTTKSRRQYGDFDIRKLNGKWRIYMWRNDHWMLLKDKFDTREQARQWDKATGGNPSTHPLPKNHPYYEQTHTPISTTAV